MGQVRNNKKLENQGQDHSGGTGFPAGRSYTAEFAGHRYDPHMEYWQFCQGRL
jgi:hypothetical protein